MFCSLLLKGQIEKLINTLSKSLLSLCCSTFPLFFSFLFPFPHSAWIQVDFKGAFFVVLVVFFLVWFIFFGCFCFGLWLGFSQILLFSPNLG